jgi:methyl-accepting chemotaxis protein
MPEMEEKKEEYELIPISPIRKLEKRIEELEAARAAIDIKEFFTQIVDIIKMNQQLVEQLVRANDMLRIEISRLPSRIEDLVKSLNELVEYIKLGAGEEVSPPPATLSEALKSLVEKIDQLVEGNKKVIETNQAIISSLEELGRKLRKPPTLLPPLRRLPPSLPPAQKS